MVLRMLAQLLIKQHAGAQCGSTEEEVLRTTRQALALADAIEAHEGIDADPRRDRD